MAQAHDGCGARGDQRSPAQGDDASSELSRASSNLDTIIADPSLNAVDKARKIAEVVQSLEAQTAQLLAANAQLLRDEKTAVNQARLRAQQERAVFDAALAKAVAERDTARAINPQPRRPSGKPKPSAIKLATTKPPPTARASKPSASAPRRSRIKPLPTTHGKRQKPIATGLLRTRAQPKLPS